MRPLLHIAHIHYIWLVIASAIAGVMNAMAGGGSFVSFPAMLGIGVAPVQANATNTVALWPGQLTSLAALRSDLRRDLLPAVCVSSVLGGVAGAEVLLHTAQHTFLTLVPWLILGGTFLFGLSGPVSRFIRRRASLHAEEQRPIAAFPLMVAMLPVMFYVGYFGAGSGFLTMTVLSLFGLEEMHALNAMKVLSVTIANLCAVITFVLQGAVVWHYCFIAMLAAAVGGYAGAKWAKRMSGDNLRAVVVVTGCVVAAYFFWRQAQG